MAWGDYARYNIDVSLAAREMPVSGRVERQRKLRYFLTPTLLVRAGGDCCLFGPLDVLRCVHRKPGRNLHESAGRG